MITTTIAIRDDVSTVVLEAYLLKNSPEFQTDRRRPAVIVCPGGAYMGTSDREAEPVALRFLAQGYHVFVLRYSVQTRFPEPMLDLAKALLLVRTNAAEWLIDPDQIAVCGFSAGGHLAASLGVMWNDPLLYEPLGASPEQIRPDALIICYAVVDLELVGAPKGTAVPLKDVVNAMVLGEPNQEALDRYRTYLHVTSATPPAFIWHTAGDQLVPAQNSLRFATALAEHQVPYELHIFAGGDHGFALSDETTAVGPFFLDPYFQVWIDLALKWLKRLREPVEVLMPEFPDLPDRLNERV